MPAYYDPNTGQSGGTGDGIVVPGSQFRRLVDNSQIDAFDVLAQEAARTKTKSAGNDLINRRNQVLQGYNPYQRYKVGQRYYNQYNKHAGDEGSLYDFDAGTGASFIDLIDQGDEQFLSGLADDPQPFDQKKFSDDLLGKVQQMLNGLQTNFNQASGNTTAPTLLDTYGSASSRAGARSSGLFGSIASRRLRGRRQQTPSRYF